MHAIRNSFCFCISVLDRPTTTVAATVVAVLILILIPLHSNCPMAMIVAVAAAADHYHKRCSSRERASIPFPSLPFHLIYTVCWNVSRETHHLSLQFLLFLVGLLKRSVLLCYRRCIYIYISYYF